MARGLRRGPNLLRFHSLVASIADCVARIVDTRQLSKICYSPARLLPQWPRFVFRPGQFPAPVPTPLPAQTQANNLSSTFGVHQIPVDSQLRDLIDRHGLQPLLSAFAN